MKKVFSKDDVLKLANLANITLTNEEVETFAPQLSSILGYVEKLSEFKSNGKTFKSQTELSNIFRKDIPKESLSNEKAVSNRKSTSKDGYIVVKGVLNK